jgi:hypothetical protein
MYPPLIQASLMRRHAAHNLVMAHSVLVINRIPKMSIDLLARHQHEAAVPSG